MPEESQELYRQAEELDQLLRSIRRLQTAPTIKNIGKMGLTMPQIMALKELIKQDGLSLKDLSHRLDLSHSTTSGIVDRLERRRLVQRKQDSEDRRVSRIHVTANVRQYVHGHGQDFWLGSLAEALRRGTADERTQILNSLHILRRLLENGVAKGTTQREETQDE